MYNSFESFQNDETDIIFLPAYYYDLLTSGQSIQGLSLKNIPTKKITINRVPVNNSYSF
jgi:hypothetical protein